jgi:hypothetical protein
MSNQNGRKKPQSQRFSKLIDGKKVLTDLMLQIGRLFFFFLQFHAYQTSVSGPKSAESNFHYGSLIGGVDRSTVYARPNWILPIKLKVSYKSL